MDNLADNVIPLQKNENNCKENDVMPNVKDSSSQSDNSGCNELIEFVAMKQLEDNPASGFLIEDLSKKNCLQKRS